MITQQELKKKLEYNPESGNFRWKVNTGGGRIGAVAGYKRSEGYINIHLGKKQFPAHRLAWLYVHGYLPENDIDHRNRIKHDNRLSNLRESSRQCNNRNSCRQCNNTSGVTGIIFEKRYKKWMAQIMVNRKRKTLCRCDDFDEAVAHRFAAEQCLNWKGCNSTSDAYLYSLKWRKRG